MEDKNPLQKEKSKINIKNKRDPNNFQHKKVIQNNIKEIKNNNNEKRQENNGMVNSDDELEHPNPLLSDYYEEDKEEIKNDFYKNKLKEKNREILNNLNKNKIICLNNNKNNILNKENIKIAVNNEKIIKNEISSKIPLKLNKKIKISSPDNSLDNKKKENNLNSEKKKLCSKSGNISKTKIKIKIKNNINKENINDNNKIKISVDENNTQKIKINIPQLKNKKINYITKIVKKNNNIIKEDKEEIKQNITLNKIPQRKKLNKKTKSQIKKSLNIIKQPELPINKDIQEVNKSSNNNTIQIYLCDKKNYNIIHKNSASDSYKRIDNKNIKLNLEGIDIHQNKSQIFNNNINININNNENFISKPNLVKKKINSNQLEKKSIIPLNKLYYDNLSKLSKNKNIISKENSISLENILHTENKVKKPKLQLDFEQYKITNSNENINEPFKKCNNLYKIPTISNDQSYTNNNNIINRNIHNLPKINLGNMPNNNYSCSNLYNNKINNIYNNYFSNINIDKKENLQNNSQLNNSTYKIPGNFNNVQTTFVVISKNTNSKIKIIPKNIKTIDYDNNKFLGPNKSQIFLKSKFYQQKPKIGYLNTEQNYYNNKNDNYYKENQNQNNFLNQQIPNMRNHKSQINLYIKNNYGYCNNQNYGNNYNNFMGNSTNVNINANQTIVSQNRNNFYLINKPFNDNFNTMEQYDNNYYDYERNRSITEPYNNYPMNYKYNN